MRKVGECAQRLTAQPAVIKLGFNGKQWTALPPAMTDPEISGEPLLIISRSQKFVSFPDAVPLFFCECNVSALGHIIVNGDNVERSGIRGGVAVGKILEPGNKARGLCDLVRHLAIFALIFADELECGARGGEIARCVECE